MKYAIIIGALALSVSACSGHYPKTALPDFWPGEHMRSGEYVNQDGMKNGPMRYGMNAQHAANRTFVAAVREWFR